MTINDINNTSKGNIFEPKNGNIQYYICYQYAV
jgi:hypothetical protein